jgi:glyoxylase-like metal-dependent hydrolase (beta-lactamase superfamily II)
VPVHVHADDRVWVTEPDLAIEHWDGEALKLGPSLTLLRCGGHFAGATVLHHSEGDGALYCGDVLQVTQDRAHVSVLYSFPNMIPVNAAAIRRIAAILDPYPFARVYGAFEGRVIPADAKTALERSFARYLAAIA